MARRAWHGRSGRPRFSSAPRSASFPTRNWARSLPTCPASELPRARLAGEGLNVVDALVEAGLAKSKGEARRTIEQGGAYVNNRRVDGLARAAYHRRPGQRNGDGAAHGQEEIRPAAISRLRRAVINLAAR